MKKKPYNNVQSKMRSIKTLFPKCAKALNERAMRRELVTTDFCMCAATDLYLFPTSSLRVLVRSCEYPPRTSGMMLLCYIVVRVSLLQFPTEWSVLAGLLRDFLLSIFYPRGSSSPAAWLPLSPCLWSSRQPCWPWRGWYQQTMGRPNMQLLDRSRLLVLVELGSARALL